MLILAGVSLNAVIGDNGIITQAQNATYMQSVAILEEFLNTYYIEHYEEFNDIENKVEALQKFQESEAWIYNPSKNGYGNISYIVNQNGQACYLINKSALPEDIRKQLKGGEANDGSYASYTGMLDVYGVTSNLKVYYSKNGIDNIMGITEEELDLDNPGRLVFEEGTPYAKLVSGNDTTNLTADDCKSVKSLTIDSSSGITDLSELYNFPSLEELILKDMEIENLLGMQNVINLKNLTIENCNISNLEGLASTSIRLNYIMFNASIIGNYKALSNLTNLQTLYFLKTTNDEISKLCSEDSGIAKANFDKLLNFGIAGSNTPLNTESNVDRNTRNTSLTDISCLNNLSSNTKEAVQYLYLNNNSIISLDGIKDFKNVLVLHCETNKLSNLNGIEQMNNIRNIYSSDNVLGDLENAEEKSNIDGLKALENISSLEKLDLRNNQIIWIDYIIKNTNLKTLYLESNTKFDTESLLNIKSICINCGSNFNISKEYSMVLLDNNTTILNLSEQTITENNFKLISAATGIKFLNLQSLKILDEAGNIITGEKANELYNEVLKSLNKLERVNLSELTSLTTLEFIKDGNITTIRELELYNTGVTTNIKNEEGEDIGLEVLNGYGVALGNLEINNSSIDLSKIQETLESLYNNAVLGYWKNGSFNGLCCGNTEILSTLENCYDISCLNLYSYGKNIGEINLENCTKLTSIQLNTVEGKINLPQNEFDKILAWSVNDIFDLSNIIKIKFLRINTRTEENFKKIIDTLDESSVIEELALYQNCSGINFSCFEDCKTVNIKKINAFKDANCGLNPQTTSVSGIKNLTGLEIFSIDGGAYTNLKNIDDLENLTNLKEFTSKNTCINSLYGLRNLVNLTYLDLTNNCIYERATNSNGDIINNLETLANLNHSNNGSLSTLYLSGNTGIINWEILSNLNWSNKSGW